MSNGSGRRFSISGALLAAASLCNAEGPANLGNQWVRTHDFMTTALVVTSDHLEWYGYSGSNTLLAWEFIPEIYAHAAGEGLPWLIHAAHKPDNCTLNSWRTANTPSAKEAAAEAIETAISEQISLSAQYAAQYVGIQGMAVWDEAKPDELPFLVNAVQAAKAAIPGTMVYTNLNAYDTAPNMCAGNAGIAYDYSDHVTDVIETGIDLVSVDAYPFFDHYGETANYLRCRYYASLESVRNRAVAADIPYWMFVQATDERIWRIPSESELRLSLFSPLAYGFKGLQLYMFWHPDSNNVIKSVPTPGITPDVDTTFVANLVPAMAEVHKLGRTLRLLKSQLVRHIRIQSSEPLPWGTTLFEPSPANALGGIESLTVGSQDVGEGIIGFFEDENHHNYFMLVNVRSAPATSSAALATTFTLTLAPWITELHRMNRTTGEVEPVTISANRTVTVTISGGTGDLFKVNSLSFVGL